MKRCAIYARVSTPEQCIDNQLYDLRQFAEQRGYRGRWPNTRMSASPEVRRRRPGLDAMLQDARKRNTFNVVIVPRSIGWRGARSTSSPLSMNSTVLASSSSQGVRTSKRTERWADFHHDNFAASQNWSPTSSVNASGPECGDAKWTALPVGRQPLDVDHDAIVADRLGGLSLTETAKRYGISRASVVRFVREARLRGVGRIEADQQLEKCAA